MQPTVGRVVWFYPTPQEGYARESDQPFAAHVAHVNADGTLNIGFLDHRGQQHAARSVPLVPPDGVAPENVSHCTWMPYQVGQAAKTEDVSAQLGARIEALETTVRRMQDFIPLDPIQGGGLTPEQQAAGTPGE